MTCAYAGKIMKTITRILITLMAALLVLPEVSFAKSKTLDTFVSKVSSSLVSFDYSFTMPTKKAKMTGNGSVKVQGTSFIVDGNGLEIWCDGKTRWTIDRISEEALVESVDDSYDSYATNPALMIASIDNAFRGRNLSEVQSSEERSWTRLSSLRPIKGKVQWTSPD